MKDRLLTSKTCTFSNSLKITSLASFSTLSSIWIVCSCVSDSCFLVKVGLGLSYASPIITTLNNLLGHFTETEKDMVSMERIQQVLPWNPASVFTYSSMSVLCARTTFVKFMTCLGCWTVCATSTWDWRLNHVLGAWKWPLTGQHEEKSNF